MAFHIGDRVVVKDVEYFRGSAGTVVSVDGFTIGVSLDNYSERCHSCNGNTAWGHGWYFYGFQLESMEKKEGCQMGEWNLQVGDRVTPTCGDKWYGEEGTVVCVSDIISVEFDQYNPDRHNCRGETKMGHGWYYFEPNELKLVEAAAAFPDVDDLL